MGLNYQVRGRLQDLNVKDDNRLIGYALSRDNIEFMKVDYSDVAKLENQILDKASQELKNLLK